ncbi:MAG: STAS domain-containing protein [Leptolyngbya sp. SIO1E4]|nr:STAS domain-containing protein [Leptolyngbya sp. SIO1E4]
MPKSWHILRSRILTIGIGRSPIAEPLTLTVSLRGTREVRANCQIFRLTGLLDAFSEPTFRKVMARFITEGPSNLILDLSGIDFVDSSGLGAMVQTVKKAKESQGSLQVIANPRVMQIVKLVRLEKFLSIRASVDEALSNLS